MIETEWKNRNRLNMLISNLKRADESSVEVGYFKEQGKHPSARTDMTFAELIAMHELRDDGNARPVLSKGMKESAKDFEKNILDNINQFMYNGALGRTHSIQKYLSNIGKYQVKTLRNYFGSTSFLKPNTTDTALRKGFQAPMIETGALVSNLAYRESISNKIQRG